MDVGYTYGGPHWERAAIYLPPGLQPPEDIEVTDAESGRRDTYVRLSDRTLACEKVLLRMEGKRAVYSGCGNYECHRTQIGTCQCGSHTPEQARPQRAEEGEPAWEPAMTKEQVDRARQRTLQ